MTEGKEKTARLYFGGLPTTIEMKLLKDAFGVPDTGVILHEQVEAVVKLNRQSNRYKTVTSRWRRHVEHEHNRVIVGEPGKGFRVLTEAERVEHGIGHLARGARGQRRGCIVLGGVQAEQLTEEQKARLGLALEAGKKSFAAAAKELRALAPPRATPQLPRLR